VTIIQLVEQSPLNSVDPLHLVCNFFYMGTQSLQVNQKRTSLGARTISLAAVMLCLVGTTYQIKLISLPGETVRLSILRSIPWLAQEHVVDTKSPAHVKHNKEKAAGAILYSISPSKGLASTRQDAPKQPRS
jgi:hypothetical protein